MTTNDIGAAGRDRAQSLVRSYARTFGVYDAELDPSGNVSFGGFGFQHDGDNDALVGRVLVAKAWLSDAPEERKEPFRKVGRALNDPAVGGLFDQDGGYFELEEDKRLYFLKKKFPLATATPEDVTAGMERLRDLAATWTVRWFGRVADITHGRALAPVRPVKQGDPDDTI
jgi:hypothetical protein